MPKAPEHPNLLFIMTDDMGAWAMHCAGNSEIHTPNLDRLAAMGMRMENLFCVSPVCSPARMSVYTGQIPSQHGVHDWLAKGLLDESVLSQELREGFRMENPPFEYIWPRVSFQGDRAIHYLRGRKEINTKKIGIIGHSAGGIIAFIVAAKDPAIAFIVSLAGAGVRGDSLMLKQVEMISKSQGMPDAFWQGTKLSIRNRYAILQQADKTTDELQKELYADVTKTMSSEQLKDLNTVQQISSQISSMTSPWYLHFMRYDPAKAMKKIKCPVLALNGEKDIQVEAAMNLTAIQQRISENGNKNVTVKAYPNLNHLFQTCEKGTLTEYGQLEETINPEVLKDIIEWIRKQ